VDKQKIDSIGIAGL